MRRRALVSLAGAAAIGVTRPVPGQTPQKVYRIGMVIAFGLAKDFGGTPMLQAAMQERGYVEGKNLAWERRFAEGQADRLPALYAELVSSRVDVILTSNDQQAAAAKKITSTIPIVMLYSDAPVELGIIASLSRPGGNITGVVTASGTQSVQKSLQMLRELAPKARHLGVLADPYFETAPLYLAALRQAAHSMGCTLFILSSKTPADLDRSLESIVKDRVEALFIAGTGVTYQSRARVIEFVALHRVPAMFIAPMYVRQGGLIARNLDEADRNQRAVAIIDKVLKGANPADIPVEQATRNSVIINLRTARAMGLKIPQSVMLQATEVID